MHVTVAANVIRLHGNEQRGGVSERNRQRGARQYAENQSKLPIDRDTKVPRDSRISLLARSIIENHFSERSRASVAEPFCIHRVRERATPAVAHARRPMHRRRAPRGASCAPPSASLCRCTRDARSANLRSCNWCPVACPRHTLPMFAAEGWTERENRRVA